MDYSSKGDIVLAASLGGTSYILAKQVDKPALTISGNNALGWGYMFLLHMAYSRMSTAMSILTITGGNIKGNEEGKVHGNTSIWFFFSLWNGDTLHKHIRLRRLLSCSAYAHNTFLSFLFSRVVYKMSRGVLLAETWNVYNFTWKVRVCLGVREPPGGYEMSEGYIASKAGELLQLLMSLNI